MATPKLKAAHCGLGSVKTNIGHLELAAGVAGVIKVLLQLKHKTLVKSLHCETINPYIQLEDSPFYIVREEQPWEMPPDNHGQTIPRRAGVSSFGFGGVNAHIVIEEYIPEDQGSVPITPEKPAIIVLSARNEERLKEQVRQISAVVREQPELALADLAYTLQVGREAMEERLGMIVTSIQELGEKLAGFLENKDNLADVYRGQVKRNKEALGVFTADEDLQKAIESWVAKRKYAKLLDLWVKGLIFDWNRLYEGARLRRISLPATLSPGSDIGRRRTTGRLYGRIAIRPNGLSSTLSYTKIPRIYRSSAIAQPSPAGSFSWRIMWCKGSGFYPG